MEDNLNTVSNQSSKAITSRELQVEELRAIERELLSLRARNDAWESTVGEVMEWISGAMQGDPLYLQLVELLLEELDADGGLERAFTEGKFCEYCGTSFIDVQQKLRYSSSSVPCATSLGVSTYASEHNGDCREKRSDFPPASLTSSSGVECKMDWTVRTNSPDLRTPLHTQREWTYSPPRSGAASSYPHAYGRSYEQQDYWGPEDTPDYHEYAHGGGLPDGCYADFQNYHYFWDGSGDSGVSCGNHTTSEMWRDRSSGSRFHVIDSGSDEQRPIEYLYIRASGRIIPADPNDRWPFC